MKEYMIKKTVDRGFYRGRLELTRDQVKWELNEQDEIK